MCKLRIYVENKNGTVLAFNEDTNCAQLFYQALYNDGDKIILEASITPCYLMVQLDDVMNPEFVYMKEPRFVFTIPFLEKRVSYNKKAFSGDTHILRARVATEAQIEAKKVISQNEYDQHENSTLFPHAYANVETRGESVFAARNAIDGNTLNTSHGEWPFESWGINKDPEASFTLDFGRAVNIEEIVLYTRADFPHDNWWKSATFSFSDGSSQVVTMKKSVKPHIFKIHKENISFLKLYNLKKEESDPSPFPALSQIKVFGTESLKGNK